MHAYQFKAVDQAGRVQRGRLSAAGPEELEALLARMGLDLIVFAPPRPGRARLGGTPRRQLIHLCFQLQQLTGAGVPLLQALTDIRDSLDEPSLRHVVTGLMERIGQGCSLSTALAEFPRLFDPPFVHMVDAGEQSGRLPEVLGELAQALAWQDEIAARARKVLTYPAVVAVVIGAVVLFLMLYLVPQLARFIGDMQGEIPVHTRLLLACSEALARWWWLPPTGVAAAALLAVAARRDERHALRLDGWMLRAWGIGELLRKLALARFARLFALMYRAGIPVLGILEVAAGAAGNRAICGAILTARERIARGQTMARAFESVGLFPPLVIRMIGVGETTGGLDTALANAGHFFEQEVRETIDRLEALIGPALTVVLGTLLGWIMLAVLGPVYDLVGRIGA